MNDITTMTAAMLKLAEEYDLPLIAHFPEDGGHVH